MAFLYSGTAGDKATACIEDGACITLIPNLDA